MLYLPIIWLGKLLLVATRLRGGGSALPGLVVESVAPRLLERYADTFADVILVAGTNGKTTTTKMIRHILEDDGRSVITNAAGSNMPRGIVSSLLAAMDWQGRMSADIGLFEVDEGFLAGVAEALRPHSIVVLNLLRDQLDRYGELDRTASLIGQALPHGQHAILNGDDPRVAELAVEANATSMFGGSAHIRQLVPHDDALHRQPEKEAAATDKTVEVVAATNTEHGQDLTLSVAGQQHQLGLQISGVFNAYNAAAAAAVAHIFGIDIKTALVSLSKVSPAFGRSERIHIGNKSVLLLLVKNPAGFNQIVDTYLRDNPGTPSLIAINDNHADGRDVSWLWDVNIEHLSGTQRSLLASGVRAHDMALRLQYAELGVDTEPDTKAALERFLAMIPDGDSGYIIPTYTAMLALRKQLQQYADVKEMGE